MDQEHKNRMLKFRQEMIDRQGFNRTHPELEKDEVFLTNTHDKSDYSEIERKSKRMGSTAYDVMGNIIDHWNPVFINKDDIY